MPGLTKVQIVVTDVLPATFAQPAMNRMRSRAGSVPVARQSRVNHFLVMSLGSSGHHGRAWPGQSEAVAMPASIRD
jgi:hypothetical protein